MKNSTSTLLSVFIIPLMVACGGNESSQNKSNKGEDSQLTTIAALEFEDIEGLFSKTSFSPEEYTRATTFLSGKEISLLGYPYAYPGGKDVDFKLNYTTMLDGIDNSSKTIEVKLQFKEPGENVTIPAAQLFAVKGKLDIGYKVDEKWGNSLYITVYDATFTSVDETNRLSFTKIAEIDITKQVFVGDLVNVMKNYYENFFNKDAFEIIGDYSHTLTSTTAYGTYHNIVLGTSDAPVHCYLTSEPNNDELTAKRSAGEKIKIMGTFGGASQVATLNNGKLK
jgi:hypothetical protein